jgi:RNA polymerase sigma-70 factor (ECF subfamily)
MPERDLTDEEHDRIERLADLPAIRGIVAGALDSLPTGERQAVSLRVVQDLDYDEVSRALHCSPEAARARVSRGLRRLQRLLEPERQALLDGGWIG